MADLLYRSAEKVALKINVPCEDFDQLVELTGSAGRALQAVRLGVPQLMRSVIQAAFWQSTEAASAGSERSEEKRCGAVVPMRLPSGDR